MALFDNFLDGIFKPRPAPTGTPERASVFSTINEWFNSPRTNYAHTGSVLPVSILSSDAARRLFYPPPSGRPQVVSILDKGLLGGISQLPPVGPRQ